MKSKRFSEEQTIRLSQEAKSGLTVADICRKYNCSELGRKRAYRGVRYFLYRAASLSNKALHLTAIPLHAMK